MSSDSKYPDSPSTCYQICCRFIFFSLESRLKNIWIWEMCINGSHIWKEKVVNDQEYPDTCWPGRSKMLCSWFQIVRKFRLGKKNRIVLNFVHTKKVYSWMTDKIYHLALNLFIYITTNVLESNQVVTSLEGIWQIVDLQLFSSTSERTFQTHADAT